MNIYKYELKANFRSTLFFIIALIFFVAFYMAFFPSFQQDTGSFMEILKGYPEGVQKALGVEISSITTLLGYYSFVLVYIVLIGSLQACNLGLNILSKEERDKTAEFLLVKPVKRSEIVLAKLAAALTLLLATNISFFIGSFLTLKIGLNESFDLKTFLLINLTLAIAQIFFIALGFFIGVFLKRMKTIMPISLALVFGFFAIGAFVVNADEPKLRYLTPFKFYDYNYILNNQALEKSYLIFSALLIIIFIAGSFIIYKKRDIESV